MKNWQNKLHYDPISPLILLTDKAVHYFLKRDLLKEGAKPLSHLWQLPEAEKIYKKTKNKRLTVQDRKEVSLQNEVFL